MLLNTEQQNAVFATLQNANNAQPEVPNQATQPSTPPQNQEVKTQTAPSSPEPSREDKSVPYDRFKEVNDKRKEYHQQLEAQRQELETLRRELESKSSKTSREDSYDDSWLDSLFSGDEEVEEPKQKKSSKQEEKYSSLEKRLEAFELKEAEKELDSMVSRAKRNNKDLNPELLETVIYKSIAENPYVDVEDVVDNLRQFVGFVRQDGIRETKPQVQPQERFEAAPRPSMTGNKTYSGDDSIKKPSTVAEARDALYKYLKNNKL